jgi:hypothetical protein
MPTLHIEAELSPEELLAAVQQLSPAELDAFTAKVLALRAARVAPSLPAAESALLQQINTPIPPEIQNRFDALRRRMDESILSEAEQREYLQLIERIERWDGDRLERLVELAHLRQKPLRTLIAELGLTPHDYAE